jgi:hypothetical protein
MLIEYDVLTNKTSAASEATTPHRCVVRLCTTPLPRAASSDCRRRPPRSIYFGFNPSAFGYEDRAGMDKVAINVPIKSYLECKPTYL